jgi:uridine kinase
MIIGIGGVSRAGKTTLAEWLRNQLPGKKTHIICQDDFVFPTDRIPRINDRINWDHPDSIDHVAFRKAIIAESKLNEIVIAEGLLVFYDRLTNSLYDSMLMVEIDYQTFLSRKDHDHRWGHEPDWYVQHIWDSFLKYGNSPEPHRTLTIDGTKNFPVKTIMDFIGQ